MNNRRKDLLLSQHELLAQVASSCVRDLERLVRNQQLLKPLIDEAEIRESLSGTYFGNAVPVVQGALSRELILAVSRLFAPPQQKRDSTESDRSLVLAAQILSDEEDAIKWFRRDSFRWAASGGYSLIENGIARDETLLETLRRRIRSGREARDRDGRQLNDAITQIHAFEGGADYARIRVLRTEQLAHSLPSSRERRLRKYDGDLNEVTFHDVDVAVAQAITVGELAIACMFRRHLSLDDLARHWEAYARQFWSRVSGCALPTFLDEDAGDQPQRAMS